MWPRQRGTLHAMPCFTVTTSLGLPAACAPRVHRLRSCTQDALHAQDVLHAWYHCFLCHDLSLPSCLTPPLLLVWMYVYILTPWLSHFHTVQLSVRSGCYLVSKLLLTLFWLCEEAQCVYPHLHLGQKSAWASLHVLTSHVNLLLCEVAVHVFRCGASVFYFSKSTFFFQF
ncbi:hypothetical protein HJG60_011198 [Phyllostomus discolor]|uniref:Uncharacterized protein n=1 Tax=Phyllostomus discolor TaxID=89673 RepID=A0A834A7B2_9CHIR|nr:hypothetical protein HJG60_011198 [Phyllostomus discolor]